VSVLIIGAGVVGSQVARILIEKGESPVIFDNAPQHEALRDIFDVSRVTIVRGDALRPQSLTEAILDHGITEVVHTAANPLLTIGAQRDPYSAIQMNVMGTVNVLEAARIHKLGRVIVASSSVLNHFMAGGLQDGDPGKEEAYPRPTTFYATTKQTIENLGLNYARWCGVDFVAVRYAAVAGPWSGRGGGGPTSVFRNAIEGALRGEEVSIMSSRTEWIYSKDAALGTVLALKAPKLDDHRVFNLTMGSLTSAEDFAEAIRRAVPGSRIRIELPSAALGVSVPDIAHLSNLTLARQTIGYSPEYNINKSVEDLVEWICSRRKQLHLPGDRNQPM
jgi:nucleoside-diphosphate-sugar epimerase